MWLSDSIRWQNIVLYWANQIGAQVLFMHRLRPHLFQTLLTEGTLGRVVQAALHTVFTEGVTTWCCHRLIEQPAFIRDTISFYVD